SSSNGQFIALEADGKIVVAYVSQAQTPADISPGLVRFNSDGSQDTGFHTTIPKLYPGYEYGGAFGLAVQKDGKILLNIGTSDIATMRYSLLGFKPDGVPHRSDVAGTN